MGKPWEKIGTPEENHGKKIGKPWEYGDQWPSMMRFDRMHMDFNMVQPQKNKWLNCGHVDPTKQ